jgi:nucleotide-binding universal stress UspA family protein
MKHVLVTTDFSELGDQALAPAADLARRLEAKLTIAHVVTAEQPPAPDPSAPYYHVAQRLYEADQELAAGVRASLEERAAAVGGAEVAVARGGAIDGLLALVRERGIDLIVMSSQGRSGLTRILLGSVTEELARRSPVPVLIWKSPPPPAQG